MSTAPLLIERGPLLNFWEAPTLMAHPHTGEPTIYRTVEHRFQAMKSTCCVGRADGKMMHDLIVHADSARTAKRMGRQVDLDVALWSRVAYAEMVDALYQKFTQHDGLRAQLQLTAVPFKMQLVEHRPDTIWGDGMDGTGLNLMGRALEVVREMVR